MQQFRGVHTPVAQRCTTSSSAAPPALHPLTPGAAHTAARSGGCSRRPTLARACATAPWERGGELAPRVSEEEAAALSAEQLAFLDRKRRGIMPQGSICGSCGGRGIAVCHCCKGSGVNDHQVDEELFEGEVRQQNGSLNLSPFFKKGWPCWLCRGRTEIGCPDCRGCGFKGASELYSGD
ncbi:MAG: hypothetical protein J3K34DRAFT_526799 [Monoraphidium minutum]|nr:MAG: hypothetical protein J3K34DRAFT_526799 [Monoraphidium minutum]